MRTAALYYQANTNVKLLKQMIYTVKPRSNDQRAGTSHKIALLSRPRAAT